MDAAQFASGDLQVARGRRADGDDDGVMPPRQPIRRNVLAHFYARHETNALGLQKLASAIDEGLVELEAGDAVAEKAADVRAAFIDRHRPTAPPKRNRRREPRRTCADDGGRLAVFGGRRMRYDPTVLERRLDDALFGLPHHHSLFIQSMHA